MVSARQVAHSAIMVTLLQAVAVHVPTASRISAVMSAKAMSTALRKSASRQTDESVLTEVSVLLEPVPVLLEPVPVLLELLEANWKMRALSRQRARALLYWFILFL